MKSSRPRRLRLPPEANRCELSGQLLERGNLRYTPAGIPVTEFRIGHASEQIEAGNPRQVDCELVCVALGQTAQLLKETAPGVMMTVSGFLAARSLKQKTPVLHVTAIEFNEQI